MAWRCWVVEVEAEAWGATNPPLSLMYCCACCRFGNFLCFAPGKPLTWDRVSSLPVGCGVPASQPERPSWHRPKLVTEFITS